MPLVCAETSIATSRLLVSSDAPVYKSPIHISISSSTTVALTVYYWTVTIDEEVETFWKGRLTGATVLFVLNRYIGLLYHTFNASQGVINFSDEVCYLITILHRATKC